MQQCCTSRGGFSRLLCDAEVAHSAGADLSTRDRLTSACHGVTVSRCHGVTLYMTPRCDRDVARLVSPPQGGALKIDKTVGSGSGQGQVMQEDLVEAEQ